MRVLRAIALAYRPKQDRILAVINPGQDDTWSCWLTRRLVLDVIRRAAPFVETSSPLAQRSPADLRSEVIAFEREAALASTAPSLTRTDDAQVRKGVETAELADRISISQHRRQAPIGAAWRRRNQSGCRARPRRLQRVLQMLEREGMRAAWLSTPAGESHVGGAPGQHEQTGAPLIPHHR